MSNTETLLEKLHNETALIKWHELQTYFARGVLFVVDTNLDLVSIAADFAQDRTENLQLLIEQGAIAPPKNDMARQWYTENTQLWAVVVAPYVLVQVI